MLRSGLSFFLLAPCQGLAPSPPFGVLLLFKSLREANAEACFFLALVQLADASTAARAADRPDSLGRLFNYDFDMTLNLPFLADFVSLIYCIGAMYCRPCGV